MKALKIIYDQKLMQVYLFNHVISVIADWPGQLFIYKAIAQQLLINNEIIPLLVISFLPIIGPLYISLNSQELIFLKNSFLFIRVYSDYIRNLVRSHDH